jgi:hypothetical protein
MSVKLNLIRVILISCALTNRNISIKEFIDIIPTNLEKYSNIVELKVIIGQIFNTVDGIKKNEIKLLLPWAIILFLKLKKFV